MTRLTMAVFAATLLAACLGTTPRERDIAALGDDGGREESEYHRPGQPCLWCHGEFQIAGTVFQTEASTVGLGGAEVFIVDGAGREIVARTNRAGNFYVTTDGEDEDGATVIPFTVAYPLRIRVSAGGVEQEMESLSWREGSCAGCHALDGPSESTESRIWVEPTP